MFRSTTWDTPDGGSSGAGRGGIDSSLGHEERYENCARLRSSFYSVPQVEDARVAHKSETPALPWR